MADKTLTLRLRVQDDGSVVLDDLGRKLDATGTAAESAGRRAGDSTGGWLKLPTAMEAVNTAGLAIAGGLALAGGAAAALTVKAIQTGAEFEKLEKMLETTEGSVEGAARAMEFLNEKAEQSPFSLQEMTSSYLTLKNFGIDPTTGALQAAVDATAKMGGSGEQLNGIILALGQAWSKEKLQGEEALQLIERGVPVWQLLSEKLGMTSGEVQKLSEKGKLGKQEIQLLIDAIGEFAGGSAVAQMQTFGGAWSNWGDTVSRSLDEFSRKSGLLDEAAGFLRDLSSELNTLRTSGAIEAVGWAMADAFGAAREALGPLLTGLKAGMLGFVAFQEATSALKVDSLSQEITRLNEGIERQEELYRLADEAGGRYVIGATGVVVTTEQQKQTLTGYYQRLSEAEKELAKYEDRHRKASAAVQRLADAVNDVERKEKDYQRTLGEGNDTKATADALVLSIKDGMNDLREMVEKTADAEEKAKGKTYNFSLELMNLANASGYTLDSLGNWIPAVDAAMNPEPVEEFGEALGRLPEIKFSDVMPPPTEADYRAKEAEAKEAAHRMAESMRLSQEIQNALKNAIADGLYLGFQGADWDEIAKVFDAQADTLFAGLAEAFTASLTGGGVGAAGGLGQWWDSFSQQAEAGGTGRALNIMSGLGMVYGGAQQGGSGGIIQGALGGAMSGASIGSTIPVIGTAWGAVIGAVVGGAMAYFGSQGDSNPHVRFRYNAPGDSYAGYSLDEGFSVYGSGDLGFSDEQRDVWERNLNNIMRTETLAYRGLVQQLALGTGDLSLFDQIGQILGEDFGQVEGTPDQIAAWIADVWLPQQLDAAFGPAFDAGAEQLGVTADGLAQVLEEIDRLPVEDRITALGNFFGVLVDSANLLEDLDWSNIERLATQTPWDAFLESMGDTRTQIGVYGAGWDDLSTIDRADQYRSIIDLGDQAFGNIVQYLAQIRDMSDGLSRSIENQMFQLELGGMDPMEQVDALYARLQEAFGNIENALTPDDVAYWTQQAQSIIGQMGSSLGGRIDEDMWSVFGMGPAGAYGRDFEGTWREYLLSLLGDLDDTQQTAAQGFEDQLQTEAQSIEDLIASYRAAMLEMDTATGGLGDAFDDTGDGLDQFGGKLYSTTTALDTFAGALYRVSQIASGIGYGAGGVNVNVQAPAQAVANAAASQVFGALQRAGYLVSGA